MCIFRVPDISSGRYSVGLVLSPMTFAAIPQIQKVGKAIIYDAGYRSHDRRAGEFAKPDIAGRAQPYFDCTVSADKGMPGGIRAMQSAAHIFNACLYMAECVRLEIDIPEFNCASPGGLDQPVRLPVDTGITNGTPGVVPYDQPGQRHCAACLRFATGMKPLSGPAGKDTQ